MTKDDFIRFRESRAAEMTSRLGADISECETWSDFQDTMLAFRDELGSSEFVERATHLHGVLSSTEIVLLQIVLHEMDYAWLADELSKERTFWGVVSALDAEQLEALLLPLMRRCGYSIRLSV
ncbi:hypothetical protein [Fodinicurvata sediminis]|uniref:hypothetical protein n=1 Tax=Fodinicurvata sediminis TaxID=1121832 RepID=UPI0003B748A4|nr:hypothetical protein [Fodinicurvata sediminis]